MTGARLVLGVWLCIGSWLVAPPVLANSDLDRLVDVMQLNEVAEILHAEGVQYGAAIDTDMLAGQGGAHFSATVARIYRADRIVSVLRTGLADTLSDAEIRDSITFFDSALGQAIISLENSARRAFADPAIEEVARQRYEDADPDDRLVRQLDTYIQVNDLIEQNVKGAMSADYSFYLGLAEGNGAQRDDQGMLATILEGRDEIHDETRTWLYGFLMMAYSPLSAQDMADNIAFSQSPAGIAVNEALFNGFDTLYDGISFDLGLAVAGAMQASDL